MIILLSWIHLLAAILWIGGIAFVSLALVPALKEESFAAQRGLLFRTVGVRFRAIVWLSVAVLAVTGTVLLSRRVGSVLDPSGWPVVMRVKLALVAALIALTALHDFWLGPQVGRLLRVSEARHTRAERRLIRLSPWVPRVGLVLALGVLLAATMLVRA